MQISDQSYDFFNTVDLQALSEMRSDRGPIFSLFLDLRPEKQDAKSPLDRFENLLREMAQQKKLDQSSPTYQEQWNKEADRIRRWLAANQSLQGQGLVVFSSLDTGLWQVFLLPVPVFDRLVVGQQPHVRPLAILEGEFKCTFVVLIDAGAARLVEVFLGRAEEVDQIEAVPVTGGASTEDERQFARSIAERVETIWQKNHCDRLVIGGSDEMSSELRAALPETLREQLADGVRLSPLSDLEDILAQVQEIEGEFERRLEAQRVEELITSAGEGGAVLGLEQTLLSVRARRARLLVVEEDFRQEGGECPNCGFMEDGVEEVCLLCGMALRPEPDIIEVALKRVLDQGGEIDVLRSQESRRALESHGRIGALLYVTGKLPPEKNAANQLTLARDGVINPDALHDEAIEESFPGSDPPSWTT